MAILIVLFVALVFSVYIPFVQTYVLSKIETELGDYLQADVSIEKFNLSFWADVNLCNTVILRKQDSLLQLKTLSLDIAFSPLLHHHIIIDDLRLDGLHTDLLSLLPASDTATIDPVEGDDSQAWTIALNHISVTNSSIIYNDTESNMFININVGVLSVSSLTMEDYTYKVDNVLIENTKIDYVSPFDPNEKIDTSVTQFVLIAKNGDLRNSEFTYNDSTMWFATGGQHLVCKDMLLDVAKEDVKFSDIEVYESYFNLIFMNDTLDTIPGTSDWKVHSGMVKMEHSEFTYDISYLPENKDHFDNNHIHFAKMNAQATELFYSEKNISINLISGAFVENNRIYIEQSSGYIYADNEQLRFDDFHLKLKHSSFQLNGNMGYHIETFDFTDNRDADLSFNCRIDTWNEVDYYAGESLKDIEGIDKIHGRSIHLKSHSKGNPQNLHTDIDAVYDHNVKLKAKGNLKNISNMDSLQFDFSIANFEILKQNIEPFITDKSDLQFIPKRSAFVGNIAGSTHKSHVQGVLKTDYGTQNMDVRIDISDDSPSIVANIDGNILADKYDNFEVKHFEFDGDLKGDNLSNMQIQASIQMLGVQLDTLVYDSLLADINLHDEHYIIHIDSKDEHAKFKLLSQGLINDSLINSKTQLDVVSFSFKESGIMVSPEILAMNSEIILDYNFNSSATILLAEVKNLSLADTIETNTVKSLDIDYSHSAEETSFSFKSDNNTIEANIYGSIDTLINNYNNFVDILVLEKGKNESDSLYFPDISLYADIGNPYELLGENIALSLPKISSFEIDAKYIDASKSIDIDMFMPDFEYDGNVMDSTSVHVTGDLQGFDYALSSRLYIDSLFHTTLKVDGDFKQRKLFTNINFSGRNNVNFIDVSFLSKEEGLGYLVTIPRDTIVILSNKWNVKTDNSLLIESSHFVAENINLRRADKEIKIETIDGAKEIGLFLKNIDLSVFNTVLANDSVLRGNANIDLSTCYSADVSKITLKVDIDTFQYENHPIGDIKISKASFDSEKFTFSSTVNGTSDQASFDGAIQFDDRKSVNINADIKRINLDFLNTYLQEYLYDVEGSISAKMKIGGSIDAPIWNGYFQFVDTKFGLEDLQEIFRVNNKKVLFDNNKIKPDQLAIIDLNNHKSYFEGIIDISDNALKFNDFHIKSEAMELMNSTKDNNQMIFGKIVANFDVKMSGTLEDLEAKSYVEFNYPTVINYTFPEDLSVSESDEIVNFTKIDTLEIIDTTLSMEMKRRQSHLMDIFTLLDAELVVDEGCRFNLYFDNSMDNYLNVTLEGDVKYLFSDESPKTSGLLNITKGLMSYSMPMVAMKELSISDNSFIQITNEVDNPFVSINAVSKIWAQTGDLVEGYNRNLEVMVFVYMRGTLDNLVVQFDVSPHTNDALITSKISQMSEKERTMNAVNLLIRGQFASKQSNVTIDVNSYVSSLIAKAMNKLISERVSFVDMSFDIKSFNNINSNGTIDKQSNLFFNVGKSFYHDRIRVNYRGNLTAKTTQNAQQYGSTDSYTENDFTIEYDITKNGNFQAVLFRKDTYEDIMEGEIVSSGGGLKIRKSYNTFAEIFKSKPKEKSKK